MSQNEESVDLNMNLFEELRDIEFTPPVLTSSADVTVPSSFEVPSLPTSPVCTSAAVLPSAVEIPTITPAAAVDKTNAKFTEEYMSILESLASGNKLKALSGNTNCSYINNNGANYSGGLFHGAGIQTTTVVGDECLVPVEFIGRQCANANNNGKLGEVEAESMDLDGIIISNDELVSLGELSSKLSDEDNTLNNNGATLVNGDLPYWAKDITIPLDELDSQMIKNDATLTALLKGDVSTAKNVISTGYSSSVAKESFSPVSAYSEDDSYLLEETQENNMEMESAETAVKPDPAPLEEEPKKKVERR